MSSDTRERLLTATIEVLAGPGVAGASARTVAAAADVSQALVFYHFGSMPELVAAATRLSTEQAIEHYRPAMAEADSLADLLAVGRRLHAEASERGAVRVMAQLLAAGQADDAYAAVARDCLELWFEAVASAVRRLLAGSLIEDLVNVGTLSRAIGASFIGLELYQGVDAAGAEAALDSLAGLGVLLDVLEGLGPVERSLLSRRIKATQARRH